MSDSPSFSMYSIDGDDRDAESSSLEHIALTVHTHVAGGGKTEELVALCAGLQIHGQARLALDLCVDLGIWEGQALMLLANWTNARIDGIGSLLVASSLKPHVEAVDPALRERCATFFDAFLGGYAIGHWSVSSSPSQDPA